MSVCVGPVLGGPSATPRQDDAALNDCIECVVPLRLTGTGRATVSSVIRLQRRVCFVVLLEFGVDAAGLGELAFEDSDAARSLVEPRTP